MLHCPLLLAFCIVWLMHRWLISITKNELVSSLFNIQRVLKELWEFSLKYVMACRCTSGHNINVHYNKVGGASESTMIRQYSAPSTNISHYNNVGGASESTMIRQYSAPSTNISHYWTFKWQLCIIRKNLCLPNNIRVQLVNILLRWMVCSILRYVLSEAKITHGRCFSKQLIIANNV
jgi:hypothetical protein